VTTTTRTFGYTIDGVVPIDAANRISANLIRHGRRHCLGKRGYSRPDDTYHG
jgi:hypothetical protein